MKHHFLYIFASLICLTMANFASAEVVKLKSGTRLTGTIIYQNEEVVVIKDASGARFQYLMTDVEAILDEEEEKAQEELAAVARPKKVTVGIEFNGGLASFSKQDKGGNVQASLIIGSANLLDKRIIVGGSLGIDASIVGSKNYIFLPIQARFAAPFFVAKDAPMISLGIGYGIGITEFVKGGLCADMQFGWRREMSLGRAFFLGADLHFQQAQLLTTETIDNQPYSGISHRNFLTPSLRLGIFL